MQSTHKDRRRIEKVIYSLLVLPESCVLFAMNAFVLRTILLSWIQFAFILFLMRKVPCPFFDRLLLNMLQFSAFNTLVNVRISIALSKWTGCWSIQLEVSNFVMFVLNNFRFQWCQADSNPLSCPRMRVLSNDWKTREKCLPQLFPSSWLWLFLSNFLAIFLLVCYCKGMQAYSCLWEIMSLLLQDFIII